MYKIKVGNESRNNLYGWSEDVIETRKMVSEYITSKEVNGFKSYYLNCSLHSEEKLIIIDYGKYSDFIYVYCDTIEEFNNYLPKNNK